MPPEKGLEDNMAFSVALDGPAGAGKSTMAKMLAKKLEAVYIDTGAMYRAMALFMLEKGVDGDDLEKIASMAGEAVIRIGRDGDKQVVYLNDRDVTGRLREEAVGNMASKVSRVSEVRERLVALQRLLAEDMNVVMDGRDIGTVVLPNARLKIYLTADPHVRALRRYEELKEKRIEGDLKEIEKDIVARDKQDMEREVSPLKQAEDAILLDSSDLSIEEVIEKMLALCREKGICA